MRSKIASMRAVCVIVILLTVLVSGCFQSDDDYILGRQNDHVSVHEGAALWNEEEARLEIEVGPMEEDYDLLVANEWVISEFESARLGEQGFPPAPALIDYEWTFESISDRIYLVVTVPWEDTPMTVYFEEFSPSEDWRFTAGSYQNIVITPEVPHFVRTVQAPWGELHLEIRDGVASLEWKQRLRDEGLDPHVQVEVDRGFLAQHGIGDRVKISTDAEQRIPWNSSTNVFGNELISFAHRDAPAYYIHAT